ncbi:ABC-three component system protein [Draconibacterium mangrovi]|uniref:ABC-three component system protein n=1 Tax=Draconibacterium mangrovi TaxID=2697469 RepID=UPI0013D1161C|nr:ABC-three component system protein [Draconibacterium mangrovi]MBN2837079.1 hypothetical protein [Candidatus Delongbacteria bacterium]
MNIDAARKHCAIVNGGSGCILQPMTNEYLYILTAKHNIDKNGGQIDDVIYFEFNGNGWVSKKITIESTTLGVNYFIHDNSDIDVALIKVDYIEGFDKIYRFDRLTDVKNDFHLLGYPEIRRNENPDKNSEWFRRNDHIQIFDPRENLQFEAGIPGNPIIEEVRGDSGGCILKIINGQLFISGIQNRMASASEQLGKIRFTLLSAFDEIIEKHPDLLAPILPYHLKSFSFLKDEAFNLRAGFYEEDILFVKNFLRDKTELVVKSSITPLCIKNLFKSRLLLFKQKDEVLHSKHIWIIWLEFLTILNILKNKEIPESDLDDIFNDIRLVYTDYQGDWSDELTNLVYSDFKGLRKDGLVVVGISTPPDDGETYILEKNIPHIASAIKTRKRELKRNLLQIDDGINFPLEDYTFIHIEYFKKKAIVSKHAEYSDILEDDVLLEKLKNEYKILIDHEQ